MRETIPRLEGALAFPSACKRARTSARSRRTRSSRVTRSICRTPPRASTHSTCTPARCSGSTPSTAPNDGPNGLTVSGSRVFGATDTTAFALDATTGTTCSGRVGSRTGSSSSSAIAPIVDRGRVYVSTQGFPPGGRGVLYALLPRPADRLALPHDQGAVGASRDARRRRRLVPGQRRRARQRVRGHRESRPLGWLESVPERRLVPRPRALHRLARRARRSHGQAPLVRPGDSARRARLRLRGVADPRERRRSATSSSARAREDGSSPGTAQPTPGSGRGPSAPTFTISARCRSQPARVCPGCSAAS